MCLREQKMKKKRAKKDNTMSRTTSRQQSREQRTEIPDKEETLLFWKEPMRARLTPIIPDKVLAVFNEMRMAEWRWDELGDEEIESAVKSLHHGRQLE